MEMLKDDKIWRYYEQTISNSVEANGENLEEKWKQIEKTVIWVAMILKLEGKKDSKQKWFDEEFKKVIENRVKLTYIR